MSFISGGRRRVYVSVVAGIEIEAVSERRSQWRGLLFG